MAEPLLTDLNVHHPNESANCEGDIYDGSMPEELLKREDYAAPFLRCRYNRRDKFKQGLSKGHQQQIQWEENRIAELRAVFAAQERNDLLLSELQKLKGEQQSRAAITSPFRAPQKMELSGESVISKKDIPDDSGYGFFVLKITLSRRKDDLSPSDTASSFDSYKIKNYALIEVLEPNPGDDPWKMPYLHWEMDRKRSQMSNLTKTLTTEHQKKQTRHHIRGSGKLAEFVEEYRNKFGLLHKTKTNDIVNAEASGSTHELSDGPILIAKKSARKACGLFLMQVAKVYEAMELEPDIRLILSLLAVPEGWDVTSLTLPVCTNVFDLDWKIFVRSRSIRYMILALLIMNECSMVFFDRTKPTDGRPEVVNIFADAIGYVDKDIETPAEFAISRLQVTQVFSKALETINGQVEPMQEMPGLLSLMLHELQKKQFLESEYQCLCIKEATAALGRADESVHQGRSIMIFTVATIIFLLLSFMSSVFGMNAKEFTGSDDAEMGIREQFEYMFQICIAWTLFFLYLALKTPSPKLLKLPNIIYFPTTIVSSCYYCLTGKTK
ncbi:hypothetical protein EYC84_007597 [Monilinia fructicola]|uniref:Uncharacterized protein n=1 Tax=Monilinia fructicola TaxID=38448 RepID=A0A5M9JIV2_MONFR|nr:hypothetical protein EYC84_007597 [Monilinia fructicola]